MDPITQQTVEVPVEDLQIIRAALNSAYHHSTVIDLAEQYRKLYQRPQQSKMTVALQNALSLTITYIEAIAAPEEEEEPNDG